MKLIKCTNGHFYDANKHDQCPFCSEQNKIPEKNKINNRNKEKYIPEFKPITIKNEFIDPNHEKLLTEVFDRLEPKLRKATFPEGIMHAEYVVYSALTIFNSPYDYESILISFMKTVGLIIFKQSFGYIFKNISKNNFANIEPDDVIAFIAYVEKTFDQPDFLVINRKIIYMDELKMKFIINHQINNEKKAKEISSDLDYGLVVDKPVFCISIESSYKFLKLLQTTNGNNLTFEREGSTKNENIFGPIDVYNAYKEDNSLYGVIYICPYGTLDLYSAPKGYRFIFDITPEPDIDILPYLSDKGLNITKENLPIIRRVCENTSHGYDFFFGVSNKHDSVRNMKFKRGILENGNILRALVTQLNVRKTKQDYIAVLSCLRDSCIWIPVIMKMSDADIKKHLLANKGDIIKCGDEVRMEPDILKSGDEYFVPIFSSKEQMGEDYENRFNKINIHFFETMTMAIGREDIVGIVLDAFTQPFEIRKDLFEIIRELPSKIDE